MKKVGWILALIVVFGIGISIGAVGYHYTIRSIGDVVGMGAFFEGGGHFADGQYWEALDLLHHSRALWRNSAHAEFMLTHVYLELGINDVAERYFEEFQSLYEQGYNTEWILEEEIADTIAKINELDGK